MPLTKSAKAYAVKMSPTEKPFTSDIALLFINNMFQQT